MEKINDKRELISITFRLKSLQCWGKVRYFFQDKSNIILLVILLFAFLLRIYGITFGLPYLYNPDEPEFVTRALHFETGDFNPHWFGHPGSSLMYLLFLVYRGYFIIGSTFGIIPNIESFEYQYQLDPTVFYLIGRTMTVLFGTMTVLFVYLMGNMIYSKKEGLIAALFFSVSLLHSMHSQLIRTDILATFFIVVSFFFSLLIFRKNQLKYYILSGLFAGFAIATKYTAGVIIFPILIAHILRDGEKLFKEENRLFGKKSVYLFILFIGLALILSGIYFKIFTVNFLIPDVMNSTSYIKFTAVPQTIQGEMWTTAFILLKVIRILLILCGILLIIATFLMKKYVGFKNLILNLLTSKNLILSMSCVLIGFLICAPFFFLDFYTALGNIILENRGAHLGAERLSGIHNHLWYITDPLCWGMGLYIEILAGLGILYSFYTRRKEELLLLSFPLLYWLAIGFMRLRWDRWIIPVIPFLAVFAASFLVKVLQSISTSKVLRQNKNRLLAIIAVLLIVSPAYNILSYDYLVSQKDTRTLAKEWIEANIPFGAKIAEDGYSPPLSERMYTVEQGAIAERTLDYYKKEKFNYIITSSYMCDRYINEQEQYPNQVNFYNDLYGEELVKEFNPNPKSIPGPTIRIYKIN